MHKVITMAANYSVLVNCNIYIHNISVTLCLVSRNIYSYNCHK